MTLVKRLAVASLLVSSYAWAQVDGGMPKAAPKISAAKPSKSIGSAKEDDEPAAPKPTTAAKAVTDADTGLLKALLFAFEPAPTEIRIIAVEDLGLLGDARALNPLAQLVMDPNPAVQLAAVRAISAIQNPRAETILSRIVTHPMLSERVKLSAIESLLFQNSQTSVEFLTFLTRANGYHPVLQQQARRVLAELPPGRARL